MFRVQLPRATNNLLLKTEEEDVSNGRKIRYSLKFVQWRTLRKTFVLQQSGNLTNISTSLIRNAHFSRILFWIGAIDFFKKKLGKINQFFVNVIHINIFYFSVCFPHKFCEMGISSPKSGHQFLDSVFKRRISSNLPCPYSSSLQGLHVSVESQLYVPL